MKLYVYEYCPFCIKARMIFPLKGLSFDMEVLLDDDIRTPTQLIGRKLLPILEKDDGSRMGESMDIVHYVDALPDTPAAITSKRRREIAQWCSAIEYTVYQLSMCRWGEMPVHEFSTPSAKAFYVRGKEAWVGPFKPLLRQTPELLDDVHRALAQLEPLIEADDAVNGELSLDDFSVFPLLHQLSVVKGVQYPARVDAYRRRMAERCNIPLYDEHAI
ncbi:glutaredoxin 2 [Zymobacter sp. IVIA_12111.31 C1]|uniref:glutaredoxin 2 n=1 Tax=Zymobacter sp. IVIA_12111.31 C1 TaxID=3394854 RepID=UPI0039C01CE3